MVQTNHERTSLSPLYIWLSTIEGTSAAKDVTKAWHWYSLAATISAQYQLALLLLDDSVALQQSYETLSVEERRGEALSWLTKSAIQGYTLATYQLELWKLTELNENTARYWLERASEDMLTIRSGRSSQGIRGIRGRRYPVYHCNEECA